LEIPGQITKLETSTVSSVV